MSTAARRALSCGIALLAADAAAFQPDYSQVPNLAKPSEERILATIDGSALETLMTAYPLMHQKGIDLREKVVQMTECGEYLCVSAVTPHPRLGIYGSVGKTPDIDIKIRKHGGRIVDWNYIK